MESEAGDFLWPNRGADKETASTRAKVDSTPDSTLRLVVTRTPFHVCGWYSEPGRRRIIRANLWLCKPFKFLKSEGRRCWCRQRSRRPHPNQTKRSSRSKPRVSTSSTFTFARVVIQRRCLL